MNLKFVNVKMPVLKEPFILNILTDFVFHVIFGDKIQRNVR
jgi:hypothetical protein